MHQSLAFDVKQSGIAAVLGILEGVFVLVIVGYHKACHHEVSMVRNIVGCAVFNDLMLLKLYLWRVRSVMPFAMLSDSQIQGFQNTSRL
jgi:hypothetical protein